MYFPEKFENGAQKRLSGSYTLYTTFLGVLKFIAPFMPHISEAVFQDFYRAFESEKSLHQTTYKPYPINTFVEQKDKIYE